MPEGSLGSTHCWREVASGTFGGKRVFVVTRFPDRDMLGDSPESDWSLCICAIIHVVTENAYGEH